MPHRLKHPVEAVIFDMDGTLHDSEVIYTAAQRGASAAMGVEITEAFWHTLIGIPAIEGSAMLRAHMGAGFDYDAFERHYHHHRETGFAAGIPVKPGAHDLLDHLDRRGMPYAIATSADRRMAEQHLGLSGLRPRFEVVVTRDDVTRGKPHPEPFLRAAERIGANPARCLAIEDSINGIRAAHAAGMMAVMVPDIVQPCDHTRTICAAVATDLHEVLRMLQG